MNTILIFLVIIFISLGPPTSFLIARQKHSTPVTSSAQFDPRFGISGLEKYTNIDFSFTTPTTTTSTSDCRNGKFIGYADQTNSYDCTKVCDNLSGAKFAYKYFKKPVKMYGTTYHGGYCMPDLVTQCNESVATPVWQGGFIACIPRYPNIIDEHNRIVGCMGHLRDNLSNTTYINYLPPEVRFTNINTRLSNGRYRFDCAPQVDSINNKYISLPNASDRFEIVRNPCTMLLKNADPTKIRLTENFQCECNSPYSNLYGNSNYPCTMCKTQYRSDLIRFTIGKSVYVQGAPINNTYFIMPPGINSIANNIGCELAELHITDSYSPHALVQL